MDVIDRDDIEIYQSPVITNAPPYLPKTRPHTDPPSSHSLPHKKFIELFCPNNQVEQNVG